GGDAWGGELQGAGVSERGADALPALLAPEADQTRRVAQVLRCGEVVVEADLIGQIADPPFDLQRLAYRVVAEHAGLPTRDVAEAQQHQDGGRLAGAIRAEQPEYFAARDCKRDAFDDGDPVIMFGEALRLEDG